MVLDLAPVRFNGVHFRAVGRQEEETNPRFLQRRHPVLDYLAVMNRVVVQRYDAGPLPTVALREDRRESCHLVNETHVGIRAVLALAVAPTLEDQTRPSGIEGSESPHHVDSPAFRGFVGDDLPLPDPSPGVAGGHGGRKAGLIQESQVNLPVPSLIFAGLSSTRINGKVLLPLILS